MTMKTILTLLLLATTALPALALDAGPDDLYVRVVDVGAGLCCVVRMPGDHYMVYDTGNWADDAATAMAAVREIIPAHEVIDLLVLSHSDADHLAGTDDIYEEYYVDRVIRSGLKRSTANWHNADNAIRQAAEEGTTLDINLSDVEFPVGATYLFGEATATMVCGFDRPLPGWDIDNSSEYNNAASIVFRLQYRGKSVLLCGDAVGRHNGGDDDELIAAEKFMVEMAPVIPIDADVVVAPHHGADNGSAKAWIEAVSPEWVVVSAGHEYEHPREAAMERYLDFGVDAARILRTDRGDDEGGDEWDHERVGGTHDEEGDDDVDIVIRENGDVEVAYR
jgi:beta-lactamase superfamily II metal-dependent hydrolase